MSRKIPAWLAAAATAFVAVLVGGAVAIGALPDSKGRINACYVKSGERKGEVRLLVSGTRCRSGEKKLSWNQEGPPGENGATNVVIRRMSTPCHGGTSCTRATFRSYCLEGERATGGGAEVTSQGDRLVSSEPLAYGLDVGPSTPTAWEAIVEDGGGGGGVSAEVSVVCVSP